MNLVNGWMYTGLGPFYLKDSSTAQNILATGIAANFAAGGVADVINSAANLSKAFQQGGSSSRFNEGVDALCKAANAMQGEYVPLDSECVQAEIHVFEPQLTPEGGTEWREINPSVNHLTGTLLGINKLQKLPDNPAKHELMNQVTALINVEAQAQAARAAEEARIREEFRQRALSAVATPTPAEVRAETAVALQALAPPPATQKTGYRFIDWLCGKRPKVVNKEVTGPTQVIEP